MAKGRSGIKVEKSGDGLRLSYRVSEPGATNRIYAVQQLAAVPGIDGLKSAVESLIKNASIERQRILMGASPRIGERTDDSPSRSS